MTLIWIIIALILFSLIVLVHEYGHFKSARIFWVRVEEFGLGIPPRAKKLFTDRKGTLFTLNWLPIWGFVKLTGEHITSFQVFDEMGKKLGNTEISDRLKTRKSLYDSSGEKVGAGDRSYIKEKLLENEAPYNLSKKPAWQQSIIILAGVAMNFLLAMVIFSVLFFIGVKPVGVNTLIPTDSTIRLLPSYEDAVEIWLIIEKPGVILSPLSGSLAQTSGIEVGDILYQIEVTPKENITRIEQWPVIVHGVEQVINIIQSHPDAPMKFYLERQGQKIEVNITPTSDGRIGSYISNHVEINGDFRYEYGLGKSILYGVQETYGQTILTFKWLWILVQKIFAPKTKEERSEAIEQMSGPIGLVDFISKTFSEGIIFLLIIGAVISINLGVFNLLPIPALDGGRFAFIVLNTSMQKLFWKKIIGERIEGVIHVIFFLLLIALSIIIAYNDVGKIMGG